MTLPIGTVNVPDCTEGPYHVEPLITGACTFGAFVLLVCVTILVYKWLDERGRR